ncbi:uncharacterized protein LOC106134838 isoform X2 [Amyelois transitella]|uniref:uncharacterized protein LOC106134838 isoform X2 n=1 Tax=Amyelois transitella TaxID=680683 RepID=UPI0029902473|nr:uncharacterized protein LOC106134838 isoform X2 [Amyelois transitella]
MPRKSKDNNEQRLLKKRLQERKRYAAIKEDPHKYELQRIKERQKYLRKKELKLIRSIKELSPEAQRLKRKKWREYNRKRRNNKRNNQNYNTESDSDNGDAGDIPSEEEIETRLFVKLEDESLSDTFITENSLLAEFQADEEVEFGVAARANSTAKESSSPAKRPTLRVAASAPPPLPPSAHPMMWPEEPTPRLRPGINADECQIFGDFVASELRTLRSDESRKRLKRMIQKAILQIGEEEDMSING